MRFLLAALLATVLFAGCETSQEDRDFYYDGWMHPERASEKRMMGREIDMGPRKPQ